VKTNVNPSFNNARKLYQHIDKLPSGPGWTYEILEIKGDVVDEDDNLMTEEVELWRRDPLDRTSFQWT